MADLVCAARLRFNASAIMTTTVGNLRALSLTALVKPENVIPLVKNIQCISGMDNAVEFLFKVDNLPADLTGQKVFMRIKQMNPAMEPFSKTIEGKIGAGGSATFTIRKTDLAAFYGNRWEVLLDYQAYGENPVDTSRRCYVYGKLTVIPGL